MSEKIFGYKGRFWYSSKRKVASLLIPKNATTSIKGALGVSTQSALFYKDVIEKGYTKVVVVREPMDKFISGYLEVIKRKKPRIKERKFFRGSTNHLDMFPGFIEEVETNGFIDEHIQLQHYAMTDEKGKMYDFDYVLLFEDLENDWNNMCEDLGKKMNLGFSNRGNSKDKKDIINLIESDDSLKKRIETLLEKDYLIYNKIIKDRNE